MLRVWINRARGSVVFGLTLVGSAPVWMPQGRAADAPQVASPETTLLESLDLFAAELDRLQTDIEETARLEEQLEGLSRRLAVLEAGLARGSQPAFDPTLPRPPAEVTRMQPVVIAPQVRAALPPLPAADGPGIVLPPPDVMSREHDAFPRIDDIPADSMPLPQVDVASHGCLQRFLRGGRGGRTGR
ncbi:MAG: hypothetical protein ACOYK7_04085 [Pirellulales bacterium]|jgi:hypothetical protein